MLRATLPDLLRTLAVGTKQNSHLPRTEKPNSTEAFQSTPSSFVSSFWLNAKCFFSKDSYQVFGRPWDQ